MKQECRSCKNWTKNDGSKSRNTDKGKCELFSIKRNKEHCSDNTQKLDPNRFMRTETERENCGVWRTSKNYHKKNTKSVEVVKTAFKNGSKDEGIVSDVYFWTDGNFYCAQFCPF